MADEYTPTTDEVRERFIDGFPFDTWAVSRDQCGREFDRWLTARDRAVAAGALREAADHVDRHPWRDYLMATPGGLLRVLADHIEKGADDGEQ